MRLSVAFPNVGPALDRAALRDYAIGLEAAGADFLMVVDHVVYAWPAADGTQRSQYRPTMWQLEPFATMGFLAGITERVGLETGIVILPQRPPALVAKDVATLDVLSGGRVRLGVGIGWQEAEYEAMGVPFSQRGARMDEAIPVLKQLWTEEHASFKGRFYTLDDVCAEPKPLQQPHPPIIFGGTNERALERAGRLGNGWVAGPATPPDRFASGRETVLAAATAAGRAGEVSVFEGSIIPQSPEPADALPALKEHKAMGATDMLFWMGATRDPGLRSLGDKLKYVERLRKDVWPQI
jgi:probable F420-dependent oxidoreductase